MKTWFKRFENLPTQIVILICILFITGVGLLDYVTGYETFFFTFYLLAIFWGTWRVNTSFGVLLSALSVTAWISSNIEAGAHYSTYFIPVWNATIMFTIYLIVVLLLARLKKSNLELEERVRLRTAALAREIQERVHLQREVLEGTEREQRRIGGQLHDGLCQHLTGTALAAHLLAQKMDGSPSLGSNEASRLVQLIEEAIEITRDLSHQLDPVELKTGQLQDHLADLAASLGQRFKLACRSDYRLTRPLEDATARHLYRIAQEVTMAAGRRPGVREITIGLDSAADDVVLTISDDGTNSPGGGMDESALGRAMTYRADLIGAALKQEHLGDRGRRFTCVLPLYRPNHVA